MSIYSVLVFVGFVGFEKAFGCVDLNGIGDDTDDYYSESDLTASIFSDDSVFLSYLLSFVTNPDYDNTLLIHETPIQARVVVYGSATYYSLLSSYEATALEFFGRVDVSNERRRCETSNYVNGDGLGFDDATTDNSQLFTLHRKTAFIYAVYYTLSYLRPLNIDWYTEQMVNEYGLDIDICDESNGNYYASHCDDESTPWGLAYAVTNEFKKLHETDGWNYDGGYGPNGRKYNKIPYSDWRDENTKYVPKNDAFHLQYLSRWQPLLETDGLGFSFYQEHVTPHIGYTARSFIYSNDQFCENSDNFKYNHVGLSEITSESVNNAQLYDYDLEMELAIDRLANLDDTKKMEIEWWDSKNNLGPTLGQYLLSKPGYGMDSFAFIVADLVDTMTVYESVIAVWKEKVDFDRVRPPTLVHYLLGDVEITSYAGVTSDGASQGTQVMKGSDWEPYIRTMPHSEYPSGSSCICYAFAQAMIEHFGSDDVTNVLGSDGLTFTFAAYSSANEPLSTPASDITLHYTTWSQIAQRCSETRLEGGMHFTDSIDAGQQLCGDIGIDTAKMIGNLVAGNEPTFSIDIEDETTFDIFERDCYPDAYDSDESSSSD